MLQKLSVPTIIVLIAVTALAQTGGVQDAEVGQVISPAQTVDCTQVGSEHKLAPSEVRELIKSASSPGDHLKLAAHFREEAAQEEAAATWHDRLAACSESTALRGHCRYLANNARKAAEHAMKKAEEQARIAQAMQNGPAVGTRHGR